MGSDGRANHPALTSLYLGGLGELPKLFPYRYAFPAEQFLSKCHADARKRLFGTSVQIFRIIN